MFPQAKGTKKVVAQGKKGSDDIDEKEFFQIEQIVAHKLIKNIYYFNVKWVGYPSSENTWEPHGSFVHSAGAYRDLLEYIQARVPDLKTRLSMRRAAGSNKSMDHGIKTQGGKAALSNGLTEEEMASECQLVDEEQKENIA